MPDLRVDTELLREAGSNLRVVATEFHNANVNSEHVAAAVGHPGLAEALRAFADEWDGTREGMMENITKLAKSATGTGQAFDQLEDAFTDSLTGQS